MLEAEDRQMIIITVFDMLREQVLEPLENLLDCLLWELMARQSVDYESLADRLESLWNTMSEDVRTGGMGTIYERKMRVLMLMRDDPARALRILSGSAERPDRLSPEWLKGIIDGGKTEE